MKYLIPVFLILAFVGAGCEREGDIDTDDCRETIQLDNNHYSRYLYKFTCDTHKTINDKTMSGTCWRVVTDGGICETVYTYDLNPDIYCPENAPYLSYDEFCHENWDYGREYVYED